MNALSTRSSKATACGSPAVVSGGDPFAVKGLPTCTTPSVRARDPRKAVGAAEVYRAPRITPSDRGITQRGDSSATTTPSGPDLIRDLPPLSRRPELRQKTQVMVLGNAGHSSPPRGPVPRQRFSDPAWLAP